MTTSNDLQKPGQTTTKHWWLFFVVMMGRMVLLIPKIRKHTSHKIRSSNLYRTCNECPLDVFIDCLVDEKYERLIKYGKEAKYRLYEAWEGILIEYSDLSKDSSMNRFLNLSKTIHAMQCKITAARLSAYTLIMKGDESSANRLKKLGFSLSFSNESMVDDLKVVEGRLKSLEIEYKIKLKEYETFLKEGKKQKANREYFDSMLIDISKFMGFRLISSQITVSEFINIRNKLIDEVKLLSKSPTKKEAVG